jgi:RNA polymerase sigma factor (sigma-70 family)
MPPPPADSVASRIFLGPALRAQPDKRLVTLVREGYETAFEEIVRRYGTALGRYAAAIVGNRSEDVTQDAFSKALPAMRRDGTEIELKPWLYRIVRNTALNDLRDRPPAAAELNDGIGGVLSAAEEAERREEIAELISRLQALPEAQRAAIVMRELEGLSHEEIAVALGVSGGAARQAIYRARVALRDGLGMLLPLPLLRLLIDHGAETAVAGAGSGAAVATGAALGSGGAGGALKLGAAAVLVAGSIGAGVVIHDRGHRGSGEDTAQAASISTAAGMASASAGSAPSAEATTTAVSTALDSRRSRDGGASRAGSGSSGSGREGAHSGEEHPSSGSPESPNSFRGGHGPGPGGDGGGFGDNHHFGQDEPASHDGPDHGGGDGLSGDGGGSSGPDGGSEFGGGDSGDGGPAPEGVAPPPGSSPLPPPPDGSSGSDGGGSGTDGDSGATDSSGSSTSGDSGGGSLLP